VHAAPREANGAGTECNAIRYHAKATEHNTNVARLAVALICWQVNAPCCKADAPRHKAKATRLNTKAARYDPKPTRDNTKAILHAESRLYCDRNEITTFPWIRD